MNILVVVAHLDDETFGMYGTLEKISKNNNVTVLSLCKGRTEDNSRKRIKTFEELGKTVGYKTDITGFFDLTLYKEKPSTIADIIREKIISTKAEKVYCTANDLHIEHGIINTAAKVAVRNSTVNELLEIYIPGSSDISKFQNKVIENIDIISKLCACGSYESELNDKTLPHIRSAAEYIGHENYTEPSELFNLVFKINE